MRKSTNRQRHGIPYNYRVQVWKHVGGTHNVYYYDYYEDARATYMHLQLSQIMEQEYIQRIRFERCSYGQYQTIFESEIFHPVPPDKPDDWDYKFDQYVPQDWFEKDADKKGD